MCKQWYGIHQASKHKLIRYRGVACAAFLALVGCVAGPDYRVPSVDLGSGWIEPTSEDISKLDLSRWWTSFNDPTLDRLVEGACTGNLSLRQAVARVAEARALRDAAAGARRPA